MPEDHETLGVNGSICVACDSVVIQIARKSRCSGTAFIPRCIAIDLKGYVCDGLMQEIEGASIVDLLQTLNRDGEISKVNGLSV